MRAGGFGSQPEESALGPRRVGPASGAFGVSFGAAGVVGAGRWLLALRGLRRSQRLAC